MPSPFYPTLLSNTVHCIQIPQQGRCPSARGRSRPGLWMWYFPTGPWSAPSLPALTKSAAFGLICMDLRMCHASLSRTCEYNISFHFMCNFQGQVLKWSLKAHWGLSLPIYNNDLSASTFLLPWCAAQCLLFHLRCVYDMPHPMAKETGSAAESFPAPDPSWSPAFPVVHDTGSKIQDRACPQGFFLPELEQTARSALSSL